MSELSREEAIEATHILNDLIGDFVAGVVTLKDNQRRFSDEKKFANALIASNKMCLSHIIISFDKWLEFYKRYHRLFSGELHKTCKMLTKQITIREVEKFRDRCIGHVLDKDTNRPLFPSEVNEGLNKIIGNDIDIFLNWVHNTSGDKYPETVTSIVEECRDFLADSFKIPHSEIMEK